MDFVLLCVLVVVMVVVAGWRVQHRAAATREAARAFLAQGAIVVDARSAAEFARGHHPGAINLPPEAWDGDLTRVGPLEGPLVVYCASGLRSRQLSARLGAAGFTALLDVGSARIIEGLPRARSEDS